MAAVKMTWQALAMLTVLGAGCSNDLAPDPAGTALPPRPRQQTEAVAGPALRITEPPTQPLLSDKPAPASPAPVIPVAAERDVPLVLPPSPKSEKPIERELKPEPTPNVSPKLQVLQEIIPEPMNDIHRLQRQASERATRLTSYYARLRRRELVKGKEGRDEVILFKFRKEPWSVHMRWIGGEGLGREVLYVKGQFENKLHVLTCKSDLMPGLKMAMALDSPMVKDSSRHTIQEAGIGHLVEQFSEVVSSLDGGSKRLGTLTYLGTIKRPEFGFDPEAVEQLLPPGAESYLPAGGKRLWVFDVKERLPMLVITLDERGREVEYYCYDSLMSPVNLDKNDFNPAKLGERR